MGYLRKHYRDLIALSSYCVLTIAMTWTMIPQISTHLAGDDSDVFLNPWADWWTRKALTEDLDFYHTNYIFYPQGTSLVFHSFSHFNTAISLLLTPLVGHFPAYNLVILSTYVLSGFGMYLLASHLTGCRPAAFVAGIVFAFQPYHIFESSHPVLVTTEFIPLFVLALVQVLHDTDANPGKRIKQTSLAALWFVLTALSSWHLMMMLGGWTVLYLLYNLIFEPSRRVLRAFRHLILLTIIATLAILPFLWPIIREQLTTDTAYMAVDIEEGRGNDLLSFFVPNQRHPVFGSIVLEVNSQIGHTRNWPAYLGYVALGLATVGIATARRRTRFWWWTGLMFFVLSLGSQIKWRGIPLHTFHLPWSVPIISILRYPLRLNTLLFFSLAVLVGFGGRWLYGRLALRNKSLSYLALAFLAGLLLFEYWVFPFPTTKPSYSPFLHQLAQEEGDFAVADFPMDRRTAKYHMFFQTIHGKRIVGGHVSRTPYDAYAFVDANPLLMALRNENVPTMPFKERLAVLAAAQDIRYVIVHKHLLDSEKMKLWQRWLVHFPSPFYEDKSVIVYQTAPPLKTELLKNESLHRSDTRLGDHIYLRGYQLNSSNLSAGDILTVTLFWQSDSQLAEDYHVFVHLLDAGGQLVAQHDGVPVYGERPTWSWWEGEVIQDEHAINIDLNLPAGTYELYVGMYDLITGGRLLATSPVGEHSPEDRLLLQDVQVASP